MFDYLKPKDGPVFDGLEHLEVVYAKNQPEYIPLRTLVSEDKTRRVTSRWTLTPEQRRAVCNGADIFLTLYTFGDLLQPIQIAVTDDKTDTGEPLDRSMVKGVFMGRWN